MPNNQLDRDMIDLIPAAAHWEEKEFEPTMHLRFRKEWVSDERSARILQQKWVRPNVFGGTDEVWRDVEMDGAA